MLRTRRSASTGNDRRGTAIVETALVIPIFFTVILGIAEFGRALMVANLLTNAAREGARLSIMNGVSAADVRSSVIQQVKNTVGVTLSNNDVSILITPYPGNPDPNNEPLNANTRDLCAIEVSVNYSDVSLVLRFLNDARIRGQAAMRHE